MSRKVGINNAILVRWHTTTRMVSCPSDKGSPLSDGHDTILVVVCHLTKMALFIPTFQDINAEDLAHIFLSQVFVKHGTPTDLISDRGKHFISHFWRSLCQLLSIQANLSTAYHPETDGKTE